MLSVIMEFSPYLQAIQKVTGDSAGKKHQTLNCLARKIIADSKDLNSIEIHPSESLPGPLIPLVKLEIARVLKKPEGVVDALKTEDQLVFRRALKVKWFFNGSVENYPNVDHFHNHIWPYISLNHRIKIIKVLANSLAPRQPTIAEEFYLNLCKIYGHTQAHPLLKACRESFIWDNIIKHQLVLKPKEVIYLFLKYPNLILEYLKLGISDHNPYKRNLHKVVLYNYRQFFPMLLKKYSRNLVELILAENSIFDIQLHSYCTELFLKNEVDELIRNPKLFLPMLCLKTVTRKLSRAQFEVMFQRLFPENMNEFKFNDYFNRLQFIPDNQSMTILLDSFKKVYNKNLLECHSLIVYDMLLHLPQEDRVKLARCRLEADKDWHFHKTERSWRCYLPIQESIPMIKNKISKSKATTDRLGLIIQLFYTCKVNNDNEALLEVLKYVTTRHKNEQAWILSKILITLLTYFNLQSLTVDHWNIIFNFVRLLHIKNQLKSDMNDALEVLAAGIHFDFLNNQSATEKLILYTELNLSQCSYKPNWNIIRETSIYERKCLEEFAKVIPEIYTKIPKEESHSWSRIVYDFTEAIYNFNKRNNKPTGKIPNFSIKNYTWLLDNIKQLVNDKSHENEYYSKNLRIVLKTHEQDLYNYWIPDDEKPFEVLFHEALTFLKNDPKKILDYYPIYYERFCNQVSKKSGQLFLRNSRWCQNIPAKFVEMSINDIKENRNRQAVLILAVLLEGPAFEKFIAPYAPKSSIINIEGDNSRQDYMLEFFISKSLNLVDPPVSLDFILPFCEGDYIHIILNCLVNVGQRVPVNKFVPFCQELMRRRASVRKCGIRLFRLVESTSQLQKTLMDLWKKEKLISVRLIIMETIVDLVNKEPCSENILMINEYLDSLIAGDENILPIITNIDKIPNEYVVEYFKKLFVVIERVGDHKDGLGLYDSWKYIEKLLGNLSANVAVLFPEELHEEILNTYLIDMSLPQEILAAAQTYLIMCYIKPARDKLDSRLKIFSSMFEKIIKNYINTFSDDKDYVGNYFIHNFTETIVNTINHSPDEIKFIETALHVFQSTSKPQLAPEFYCKLLFITLYNDGMPPQKFAAKIVDILPFLVDIFSIGFISTITYFLSELIEHFYRMTKSNAMSEIIEFLFSVNSEYPIFLGTSLLLHNYYDGLSCSKQLRNFIKSLRQHSNPLLASNAYLLINKHYFNF